MSGTRRGKLRLTVECLEGVLKHERAIPRDAVIRLIYQEQEDLLDNCFHVMMESQDLPVVHEGCPTPYVNPPEWGD
jgi:hypothetical protein